MALSWHYYGDSYGIKLSMLKEKFFRLYGEYTENSKGSSQSPNPSSSNAQGTSNVESQSNSFMKV